MRPVTASGSAARGRVAAAVIVLGLLIAGCSHVVAGSGSPAGILSGGPTASSGPTGSPSGSGSTTANPTPTGDPVTCPVVDRRAGVQFDCLVASGSKNFPNDTFSSQILVKTESNPDWYMGEYAQLVGNGGSGGLGQSLELNLANYVSGAYPDGSKGKSTREGATTIAGKKAYMIVGTVTVRKTGSDAALKVTQDRLVAVIVQRDGTAASMFIIAVPDTNKSLWPKMETIARGIKLV